MVLITSVICIFVKVSVNPCSFELDSIRSSLHVLGVVHKLLSTFMKAYTAGQFHVTTDTTQKKKSSYAEYLVLVLYCTHITCHGFKGNMQIQLNNSEISPFAQLCEKL